MTVVEHIRATLEPVIQAFAASAGSQFANARVEANVGASDNFPFYATVSVSEADPAGDEVVVLSVDVWTDGTEVRLSSDLAEGGGRVVVEGPTSTFAAPLADCPEVRSWLASTGAFAANAVPEAVRHARMKGLR